MFSSGLIKLNKINTFTFLLPIPWQRQNRVVFFPIKNQIIPSSLAHMICRPSVVHPQKNISEVNLTKFYVYHNWSLVVGLLHLVWGRL